MTGHNWTKLKDSDMLNTLGLLREQCSRCGAIRGLGKKLAARSAVNMSALVRVAKAEIDGHYYVQNREILEDCDEERIRNLHIT